jgi:hypothetical protein
MMGPPGGAPNEPMVVGGPRVRRRILANLNFNENMGMGMMSPPGGEPPEGGRRRRGRSTRRRTTRRRRSTRRN